MNPTSPDDPQRVFDYTEERIARGLGEPSREGHRIPIDGNGGPPHPPDMDTPWRAAVDTRLANLESGLEGVKTSVDTLRWVVGIIAVVMIGGFSFLGFQLNRLEGRIDRIETAVAAIPARLSDEFHAMRSEMAAQTSAIANSITATRQAQPPPPQIIIMPEPRSGGQPSKP